MFKYYSSYFLLLTGFTHLLCCGIPIVFGLSSIFTSLLNIESSFLNFENLEAAENYLFTFTTIIFLVLISLEFYKKKIKCSDSYCSNKELNPIEYRIKFNLVLASILYLINSIFFISEKIY